MEKEVREGVCGPGKKGGAEGKLHQFMSVAKKHSLKGRRGQ